jgi:Phytoene/squalene synthetase
VSVDHYENFPVASILLPRRLRAAVRAIYRFARSADDIADEGNASALDRLAELDRYGAYLDQIEHGAIPEHPVFTPLAQAIRSHRLPIAPFRDLLAAFSQDVEKNRYADFAEVMQYCRHSANPVGQLMLHLYGEHDSKHQAQSDAICSSLQLINFLQDIAADFKRAASTCRRTNSLRTTSPNCRSSAATAAACGTRSCSSKSNARANCYRPARRSHGICAVASAWSCA